MVFVILSLLVVAVHLYFVWLECFRWDADGTRRTFGTTAAFAAESRAMALNQGLYNGFLAVGIFVAIWSANAPMATFLLICVAVAGLVGAATVTRKAFYAQTVPAALALIAQGVGI